MHPTLKLADDPNGQRPPPTRYILVVDDEKPIVWMLQESLGLIPNCEVLTATSGIEALQLCQDYVFELLLTDYKMPDMDGLTLATQVRHLSPRTTVIMLTAYGDEELIQQAAAVGIKDVLSKPIRLTKLREIIQMALSDESTLSG